MYVDYLLQIKSKKDTTTYFRDQIDYRISALKSANIEPTSVRPDNAISRATTIMTAQNYSQLPVVTGNRTVKGVVTWKSIAQKISNGYTYGTVKDYMVSEVVLNDNSSMFDAIDKIKDHDYVLVRDSNNKKIKGIVTASDLSEQFGVLAEPFLLIGKCEIYIRRLIYGKYSIEELQTAKNPADEVREIHSVHDLTFGEYARLLEVEDNWAKLFIEVDQKYFIEKLMQIMEIRNDIMHFDPSALNFDQIEEIRSFNRLVEFALLKNTK